VRARGLQFDFMSAELIAMDRDKFVTKKEAAKLAGVHEATIHRRAVPWSEKPTRMKIRYALANVEGERLFYRPDLFLLWRPEPLPAARPRGRRRKHFTNSCPSANGNGNGRTDLLTLRG